MTLNIQVKDAIFQQDLDTFSKMDPYVVLKIGTDQKRTKTCNEGGQAPKWNETIVFNPRNFDVMKIEVYDEDLVSPDFIGEAAYNLTKVKSMPGQPQNEWIQVMKKGKNAGRVRLILTYNGQNNANYQQQPQQNYGMNNMNAYNPQNNPNYQFQNQNYQFNPQHNMNYQPQNVNTQLQPQQQPYPMQTAPDWNRFGTIPTNPPPNYQGYPPNMGPNVPNQQGMQNAFGQFAFQMMGNQPNQNFPPGYNPGGGVYGSTNGW